MMLSELGRGHTGFPAEKVIKVGTADKPQLGNDFCDTVMGI